MIRRGAKITKFCRLLILIVCFTFNLTFADDKTLYTQKNFYHRIVALSPHAVEMLYAIGAGDLIVGTVEHADFPQAAIKIPRIGSYTGIQIEKVLALQPDLIVAWKNGNKADDLNRLDTLGFDIFYTQPKTIDEIGVELIKLGLLTNRSRKADAVAKKLRFEHHLIKQQYINKAKVKVFYQLWKDPLRTVGKNSWIDSLIMDCNGENLFNDTKTDYPMVSLESILLKNPQVIIIPNHSGEKVVITDNWLKWNMIDAVTNNHIYTINGDLIHRLGPRSVEGLNMLCKAINKARN